MTPLATLELAALGAVIGSGFTTLGLRLAQGRPWLNARSACDGCGRQLGYGETVPLLGFALCRGHCRSCGDRIPRLHLAAEVGGALLLPSVIAGLDAVTGGLIFLIAALLLATAITDWHVQRLPDPITAALGLICALLALLEGKALLGLASGVAAVAVLSLLRLASQRLKGDPGLGLGDVKLIGALALWLGVLTPLMVALAAGLGLVAVAATPRGAQRRAFGPYLAVSGLAVGLGGMTWGASIWG